MLTSDASPSVRSRSPPRRRVRSSSRTRSAARPCGTSSASAASHTGFACAGRGREIRGGEMRVRIGDVGGNEWKEGGIGMKHEEVGDKDQD